MRHAEAVQQVASQRAVAESGFVAPNTDGDRQASGHGLWGAKARRPRSGAVRTPAAPRGILWGRYLAAGRTHRPFTRRWA